MLFDKVPKLIDGKVKITVSIIVFVIIGSLFFELNGECNHLTAMSYGKYGNYIYFILSSVLLSSATFLIALLIDNPLFAKYGKLTLPIYAFHLIAVGAVNMIYSHSVELLFESYNLMAVAVGTVSLIITCAIIPIIRGVDSNLIGEHK